MRIIIVVDAYAFTPYKLQQAKMSFEELWHDVQEHPEKYQVGNHRPAQVLFVDQDFSPPNGTLAIASDDNGQPYVWKSRVD